MGLKILAVDDNPDILVTVENHLIGFDYEVRTASNASEALATIRSGFEPTVLFTDIVMPGAMDGCELGRVVQEFYPHVGVLLTTGWAVGNTNGFDVLLKPFELSTLTDWISIYVEKSSGKILA